MAEFHPTSLEYAMSRHKKAWCENKYKLDTIFKQTSGKDSNFYTTTKIISKKPEEVMSSK